MVLMVGAAWLVAACGSAALRAPSWPAIASPGQRRLCGRATRVKLGGGICDQAGLMSISETSGGLQATFDFMLW